MSNPSDAGGGGRFSDRQQLAKRLEKSNFAQTCSLLSQFLKEKRSLANLSTETPPRKKPRDELEKASPPPPPPPPTVNTLNSSDDRWQLKDDLPKFVGFPPSGFSHNSINKGEFRKPASPEPATAQITIFYAGKVLVYDDFPNERAKEIMALADKGSRSSTTAAVDPAAPLNRFVSAMDKTNSNSAAGEPNVMSKTQAPVPVMSKTQAPVPVASKTQTPMNPVPEKQLKPQTEAKSSSDLPIARRASLHRFLEKRKDRAVSRAPCQVNQQPEAAFKASGSSSGIEPEPEPEAEAEAGEGFPRHLDLNL